MRQRLPDVFRKKWHQRMHQARQGVVQSKAYALPPVVAPLRPRNRPLHTMCLSTVQGTNHTTIPGERINLGSRFIELVIVQTGRTRFTACPSNQNPRIYAHFRGVGVITSRCIIVNRKACQICSRIEPNLAPVAHPQHALLSRHRYQESKWVTAVFANGVEGSTTLPLVFDIF